MRFGSVFKAKAQRPRDRSQEISALNATIDVLNVAKDLVEILPVKGVFGSACTLLAPVRVSQDLH